MGFRFQCPGCNAVRAANDRLLGREIKCPECGGPVLLPTQEQIDQSRAARRLARAEEIERERLLNLLLTNAETDAPTRGDRFSNQEDDEAHEERLTREERALAAATTSFRRPSPPRKEDMDMTPMVDVTFLLLIFFMVTASFSVQKSIQRPAQRNEEPSQNVVIDPEKDKDTVTVQVDEFNAYNVITANGDRTVGSKQDLIVALVDAFAGGTGGQASKLVIEAHENCIHAAVIAALDAGREAKFETFEVTTVEQFD
jgi:biopolymer transport protein ExbD